MTTIQDVILFIADQATSRDLTVIFDAGNKRAKVLAQTRASLNAATLNEGDHATLTNISPKYLAGVEVVIVKMNGTQVEVRLADPDDRFAVRNRVGGFNGTTPFRVQASCLIKKEEG